MDNELAVVSCSHCGFYTDERPIVSCVERSETVVCPECNKGTLACDHPGSHWDSELQVFVCTWCGAHDHKGTEILRNGVKEHIPNPAETFRVDITDH